MDKYAAIIRAIVSRCGGHREKSVLRNPHTLEQGETWNDSHKVIYILPVQEDPDGYRAGFAVDIVTRSICG